MATKDNHAAADDAPLARRRRRRLRRRFRYIRRITRLSRDERIYLRMLLQDVGEGPRRRKRKLER